MDWPVYVSHAEATAYAKWLGRKLPTEEQFHRAAYGTSDSEVERNYPWGEEAPEAPVRKFDFAHWDPSPVGSYPRGASALGVQDVVATAGNGRARNSNHFPDSRRCRFYPGYSANFFDGKHYVMKGGSPRTAACMLRRSFRNWFQPHYPYVLRNVPLRRGLNPSNPGPREPLMLTYQTLPVRHVSEFAAAVREGLLKPGQRELPPNICMTR